MPEFGSLCIALLVVNKICRDDFPAWEDTPMSIVEVQLSRNNLTGLNSDGSNLPSENLDGD